MGAVVIAVIGVAVIFLRSGDSYAVKARFQNASQLVKGNLVQVAGRKIGSVDTIELTDDGQAEIGLKIDEEFAPLRRGTQVTVRQASLSGIANRYVDVRLGPGDANEIPDGGIIEQTDTTTAVDLDQLFNVFDERTRRSLSNFFKGSATQYGGRGREANAGFLYLNPALASSSRLFEELNADTPMLERFIVESSRLVTDLADREEDLAGLVDNLATTTGALANQRTSLAESIRRLPAFMRRANTTFVNLRATIDDLDPLVEESKPVVRKLRPFLADLRAFAGDAQPTIRDLSAITRSPGANNDLIDLTNTAVPLRDVAVGPIERNGAKRLGALPASTKALGEATPEIAFARPYAPDLVGWFNDFSTSGVYDALGTKSRPAIHVNAFTLSGGLTQTLVPLDPDMRRQIFQQVATLRQDNRCPGSSERPQENGGNPFVPVEGFNCDPTQLPPGR